MFLRSVSCLFSLLFASVFALRYDPAYQDHNLNQNQSATHPTDYWGQWENHTYHPSPDNWRFPFYTVTLDRFVDGDPTNNEANGTVFEHDWMTNQFRFGGDALGLMGSLDYIQGMGVKVRLVVSTSTATLTYPSVGPLPRWEPFHQYALVW